MKRRTPPPISSLCAMCCADQGFQTFLRGLYNQRREIGMETPQDWWEMRDGNDAAQGVYEICQIKSRKELVTDKSKAEKWEALYARFFAWSNPRFGAPE